MYNRLQTLLAEEDRKIWVFWNEERRETATKVEQYQVEEGDDEPGHDGGDLMDDKPEGRNGSKAVSETINDRNDRGESCTLCVDLSAD